MRIKTILQPRGPAAAIVLTDEERQSIAGGRKAAPVRVTVNGEAIGLRMTSMRGETLIGFSKAARAACGVDVGDTVDVEIVLDDAPREVELPADLAAALDADPAIRAAFDALAFTHRKAFVTQITEAKRSETRERRVTETLAAVREGRTRR